MSAELLILSRPLYGLMIEVAEERTVEVRLQKPAILPSSRRRHPKTAPSLASKMRLKGMHKKEATRYRFPSCHPHPEWKPSTASRDVAVLPISKPIFQRKWFGSHGNLPLDSSAENMNEIEVKKRLEKSSDGTVDGHVLHLFQLKPLTS
jgi:hypothetical protein